MNRYPLWKYILIVVAILLGALYTAPNYYGESPAVQVTSGKSTVKMSSEMTAKVEEVLKGAGIATNGIAFDGTGTYASVRARFADPDTQFRAKSVLEKGLNADPADPTYLVALNLQKDTPKWLQALHALPMYLGLDLRGGVHFLMQVDTKAVLAKRVQGIQAASRTLLRDKNVRHAGIDRVGDTIEIKFRDDATRQKAKDVLQGQMTDLLFVDSGEGDALKTTVSLKPAALKQTIDDGVKQNIATLSKRVNELGVSEPVLQQQGPDRIVVQLPGVQDVARARAVIGRTATLEVRMVDETVTPGTEMTAAIPFNSELFTVGKGVPVVLTKDVVLTGDYISSATASFDQNQQPAVGIDLNGDGGRKMRDATRDRVGKKMAIVLFEKGKPEVLSVATIQSELGSRFQITGMGNAENSAELALLLRSGALSAPMDVIEERTIGPQLGAENISKGLHSTMYGFAAIALFMIVYYMMFGFFSVLALACNLLLLVALLSLMQATLTLPGIAAIALALGMAIDANVLINERIREELRSGATPQAAISAGFDRAWATIIDSNVTTLIVGIALWVFGSGPIRGFAVVHCLGILTSMFSAVFISRGVVNLWYGRKKKLQSIAIGTVWVPGLK
ncbi:protein translocase subunit SecD [Duganella sp. BJB488]|uniref:protein translocase subunit SecD n=1 Tax=unclassified Duganella TaxID=2636909 RepID=UPI000E344296|nr:MULTISPECIES: protein translocase subunit SecD [unclassified Duganella]NVD74055.1 protein translocase subunit SecD [Duganella sp. BJB1802]RFP16968.1 protein translocase subunit SecD [Duganella sp. BJB489]RFP20612.1 protein translocase subunit SecD [Duganella sp. BJB488]RFP32334.1 protein translocase subunit SecD [Duganella sp. BJB480]